MLTVGGGEPSLSGLRIRADWTGGGVSVTLHVFGTAYISDLGGDDERDEYWEKGLRAVNGFRIDNVLRDEKEWG